jgi:hypothetical protein
MFSSARHLGFAGQVAFLAVVFSATASSQVRTDSYSAAADMFSTVQANLNEAADRALKAALEGQPWMKGIHLPPPDGQHFSMANANSIRKLQGAIDRVNQLRSTLEPVLSSEGVPAELSAVVLVESGGIAAALSPKGARGVWQLMPDTARRYGLVIDGAHDDRTDVIKSTHAAARYLRDLYTKFGDWSLAMAAYNAGEDAVERALDRASSRDFNAIARAGMLPQETRNYVPAVLNAIGRTKSTAGNLASPETGKSAIAVVVYAVDEKDRATAYE